MDKENPHHFEGKSALEHVTEKRASAASEVHGTEIPGPISSGADSAREMAVALLILTTLGLSWLSLLLFASAYFLWKIGRSAWLGWSRLGRLHRVVQEERWEIEHHRPQERDELIVLYGQKGFEGELLEEVVDVLMADSDRLLRVMLEEEMGLTLEAYPHPLKLAAGAGIGAIVGAAILLAGFFIPYGAPIATFLVLGIAATVSAHYEKNRLLPAIIWNLAIGAIAYGFTLLII